MSRKKRQGDPNKGVGNDDGSSSDSCDENQNTTECPHINKSVDLQKIRKAIVRNNSPVGFASDCDECKKSPDSSTEIEMNGDYEFDLSLWMCLKCGNQACGRFRNQHALHHYKTPHSDSHALCVNTTTWIVWCYECDDEVNVTARKKLVETVEHLRKLADSDKKKQGTDRALSLPSLGDRVVDVAEIVADAPSPMEGTCQIQNLPSVRGLSNLGNTCFFNSVMQCLGQTPYLFSLLEETSQPGQTFRLPGGQFQLDTDKTIELEPLEGILDEWRPLTRVLAETLEELQSGRKEVYVPRMLLSRLTQRMPQFGGGHQQDAHELLRHLLEAVREEDLRRYQTVILDKLGLSKKTDPSSVEGEKKKIIRFYGQQASEFLLPTEQVFRGVLLSTLQCQECEHTSHREEFFLDLSLPISEKQIPPALRRKAEEIEDNKPSQYQSKKEKRAEKKKKKLAAKSLIITSPEATASTSSQNHSDSESDADVEDNVEDKTLNTIKKYQTTGGSESGYNSDKATNGSPTTELLDDSAAAMCVDDSGVPSPAIGMLSVSPDSPETSFASMASADINIEMGGPSCGRNSPNDEEAAGAVDRPESRLSFVSPNKGADLKVDFSRLSLLNDGEKRLELGFVLDGAYGGCEDEKMEESCDTDDTWMTTMSARYMCEKGECSVQSCLNQFTAAELLTGNNKVGCELCTKRHGGPEKKTVYTNAMKQLLIYNPPAVLILHLKRFQVQRFRSTKLNKPVTFQTVLDLSPFCSKKSRDLPTFDAGQNRVLYSLYGVVEHSGSIHGGHYVAFVKVRPHLEQNSYRWQFLPRNQAKINKSLGAKAEPVEPSGKWYYVSDSYVSEVSEAKVLSAQAYLLFYERIL